MVFSLIGWDIRVSSLLAGIAKLLADDGKVLWLWGDEFENNLVGYCVASAATSDNIVSSY